MVTLIALAITNNDALYAHGVLSKETGQGKINFCYDDGSPVAKGYVNVYDKEGKEIATGQTDIEGNFDFSKYENVGKISVADVYGHHQTHVFAGQGQDHSTDDHEHAHDHHHSHSGHAHVIIGVVAILLVLAAVFYLGNKKKNNTPPQE